MGESALKILIGTLEASRSSLYNWLLFWTLLVAAGVVLEVVFVIWEYREDLHDFRRGIIHSPEKPKVLLLVLGLLGAGLVAAGVAGESVVESKLGTKETEIRNANGQLISLISKDAGDAAGSARIAHEEVDGVKKEAGVIDERLGKASTHLDEMEQEILIQGPRWGLLKRGENTFIETMKPFAGQKATVMICGQGDTERSALEQVLLDLLRKAGWSTDYKRWSECPTMLSGGNEMFFVSAADTTKQWIMPYFCGRFESSEVPSNEDKTVQSGKVFCDTLEKLGIATTAFMEAPPRFANDEEVFSRSRLFFANGTAGGPAELAVREPSTIFILIGPHPPEFGVPKHKIGH